MSSPRFVLLSIAAALAAAILLTLGAWQLQRMEWKQGLLEKMHARSVAPPVSLARAAEMSTRSGDDIRFLRVSAQGRYHHDAEIHLYGIHDKRAGWRVITPFETTGGRTVLVIRGFVPEVLKSPEARPDGQISDVVSIVARVRFGEVHGMFFPDNVPGANEWFWRDQGAMRTITLEATKLNPVAFYLELEIPAHSAQWPRPDPVAAADLHNRHFQYALTWFGLAAALVVIYGLLWRSRMKP